MLMSLKANSVIEGYVRRLDSRDREIVRGLAALIQKAAPHAEVSIKWGIPWWQLNGLLCTVYSTGDHVNFGFSRGTELADPAGLLEGTGKLMRHIKLRDVKEIRKAKFTALVKQAVKLNLRSGDTPKV